MHRILNPFIFMCIVLCTPLSGLSGDQLLGFFFITPKAEQFIQAFEEKDFSRAHTKLEQIFGWISQKEKNRCQEYILDHFEQFIATDYGIEIFKWFWNTLTLEQQHMFLPKIGQSFGQILQAPEGMRILQYALNTVFSPEQIDALLAQLPPSILVIRDTSSAPHKTYLYPPQTIAQHVLTKKQKRALLTFEEINRTEYEGFQASDFEATLFNKRGKKVGRCSCFADIKNKKGWIRLLHVNQEERQKGYGDTLLTFVQKALFKTGCTKIGLCASAHDLREGEHREIMQQKLIEFYKMHGGNQKDDSNIMEFESPDEAPSLVAIA